MQLHEYIEKAKRTESVKEQIIANKTELNYVFGAFVTLTEMMDCLKKKIFYSNSTKYDTEFHQLAEKLDFFNHCSDRHHDIEDDQVLDINPRLFHAILGIATESGESIQQLMNGINGHDIDYVNLAEEFLGDISWYQAIGSDEISKITDGEIDWEESLKRNIAKLAKRFPDKYSDYHAENRNLDEERKILEGK